MLVIAAPRVLETRGWLLLQAVRDVGVAGGWRCLQAADGRPYVYDPSHASPDAALLAEAPEATVADSALGVVIDRVEVDLRSGGADVWAHVTDADGSQDHRVYVLSPGDLQGVIVDSDGRPLTLCNSHLSHWKIVSQQELG